MLGSIGNPLSVNVTQLSGKTTPTDTYAVAIAVIVSLMFVTLLLASAMLARSSAPEHAYSRLVRGLISKTALLAEKIVLSAGCAAVVTVLMAAFISLFVHLDWGRFELWVLALAFGGLAFGALGVAIGGLAREVSVASLMAFLIALPIAFIALIPGERRLQVNVEEGSRRRVLRVPVQGRAPSRQQRLHRNPAGDRRPAHSPSRADGRVRCSGPSHVALPCVLNGRSSGRTCGSPCRACGGFAGRLIACPRAARGGRPIARDDLFGGVGDRRLQPRADRRSGGDHPGGPPGRLRAGARRRPGRVRARVDRLRRIEQPHGPDPVPMRAGPRRRADPLLFPGAVRGDRPRGRLPARGWAAAAAIGAAIGLAVGGILSTQLFTWRAIFFAFQAPVAAFAAIAVLAARPRSCAELPAEEVTERADLDPLTANLALALLSAGLIGALFLVVIELINAWLVSPIGAAAIVTTIPVATAIAERLVRGRSPLLLGAFLGAVLVVAGLVLLSLVSHKALGVVVVALVLCGAGLGLGFPGLDGGRAREPRRTGGEGSQDDRRPRRRLGPWPAAAHAGVVRQPAERGAQRRDEDRRRLRADRADPVLDEGRAGGPARGRGGGGPAQQPARHRARVR